MSMAGRSKWMAHFDCKTVYGFALEGQKMSTPEFGESVRQLISGHLEENQASLEAIAARMGLHPRALSRGLSRCGLTFSQLRDDVRFTLAKKYVASGMRLEDVSWQLGYSDPSTFYRAFKRWSHQSPSAYRDCKG